MKLNHFRVFKPSGTVDVLILKHKGTNEYSFVNLTKGHICPCRFQSLDEAIADLEQQKNDRKIFNYWILEAEE